MRSLLLFVLAGALLGNRSTALAVDPVTVTVWPDKLLYDVGEPAQIAVTVTNAGAAAVQGQLTVRVLWEIEDAVTILQEPVALKPGEKKVIAATWKTSEVLGGEARAEIAVAGKPLATGREYFNVCRARDAQRVGIHTGFPDLFTYPGKAFLDTIPPKILQLRQSYCNIVEHFGWAADHFADLAPQEENWLSSYWQNKTAIKTAVAEEHRQGLKSLSYVISCAPNLPGSELLRNHPDWFLHQPDGKPWAGGDVDIHALDVDRTADRRGPFVQTGLYLMTNFSLKPPLDFGIQQLIASKKMFGWDGVRFDGHYIMWTAICRGARDLDGKLAPAGQEADAIDRANTAYTKAAVHKVFPDYLFMFNASTHQADIDEICSDGGAPANEPIRESYGINSQWNSWQAFTAYLLDDADRARKRGGYAYAYLNPPFCVCPNVDRIQYPILFATGCHPWFAVPRAAASDTGGSHGTIQTDLFRFATRFSAVLWGHGIERVKSPASLVAVTAPTGHVWWQDFVYQRPLPNGRRQLVIHLINEPPTPGIAATTQPLPAPVKDVTVTFQQPVDKVWLATAEPAPTCRPLPLENGTVQVPELALWSIVIAEREGR